MLHFARGFAALIVIVAGASFAPAQAQTYRIKQGVSQGYQNMRSGPGQGHGVVAQIPAGTGGIQAAGGCQDPDDGKSRFVWCKYSWQGTTGWMSSNGLEQTAEATGGGTPAAAVRPAPDTARPPTTELTYEQCIADCAQGDDECFDYCDEETPE